MPPPPVHPVLDDEDDEVEELLDVDRHE